MLETLYADFTTKVLPQIQEGLVITQEYFTDLFGRYIKYLIITDSIQLVLCALVVVNGLLWVRYAIKFEYSTMYDGPEPIEILVVISTVIFVIFGIIAIGGVVSNITDLIKDIYIPEVRVYEELSSFMSNK